MVCWGIWILIDQQRHLLDLSRILVVLLQTWKMCFQNIKWCSSGGFEAIPCHWSKQMSVNAWSPSRTIGNMLRPTSMPYFVVVMSQDDIYGYIKLVADKMGFLTWQWSLKIRLKDSLRDWGGKTHSYSTWLQCSFRGYLPRSTAIHLLAGWPPCDVGWYWWFASWAR